MRNISVIPPAGASLELSAAGRAAVDGADFGAIFHILVSLCAVVNSIVSFVCVTKSWWAQPPPFLLLLNISPLPGCSSSRAAVIVLKWRFRCEMEREIFTSLINKIISQLRARQALIYRVISLHSLFFILFSKQTKQQRAPEWKCREESQIKTWTQPEVELQKNLEGSAAHKGIPADLGIQRRIFPCWCLTCSVQGWKFPVKSFLTLCRAGFSPGLQQESFCLAGFSSCRWTSKSWDFSWGGSGNV